MSTIIISGSYGELIVHAATGHIIDRSGAGEEYADICYFIACPDHDEDILLVSFVTDGGEIVPACFYDEPGGYYDLAGLLPRPVLEAAA